jgi:ABC-type Zn uptake system ZnuABC Zn-binding protein ZnuA
MRPPREERSAWLTILGAAALLVTNMLLAACRPAAPPPAKTGGEEALHTDEMPELAPIDLGERRLQVAVTLNILADIVSNVGGDLIEVTPMLGRGDDPHTYSPGPQDVALVSRADVLFINGAGLEAFMGDLIEAVGKDVPVVPCSHGVELIAGHEGEREHAFNPHTYLNPANVMIFVDNIEATLGALDPANAETYAANADAYRAELEALDAWIAQQIAELPEDKRKIVVDHESWGYLTERYGLEQVGAVVPDFSTDAEPSPQDIAALQAVIEEQGVKVIFVSTVSSPDLAAQIAEDTGIQMVFLYDHTLGPPGSGAETYIDMMRYNINAIIEALR